MEPIVQPSESLDVRYRRQLRELLVARVDFRDVSRSAARTEHGALRRDLIVIAEDSSETCLSAIAPQKEEARTMWGEVADGILECVASEKWDQLQLTPWAVRTAFAWWYEMNWFDWLIHRFSGFAEPRPVRICPAARRVIIEDIGRETKDA